MEATHSTVQWAMSEHWHYVDSKSEENPQSRLEATDLFSVDMRAGDIQIEPKVSNLSAGWHRSERSNPVSQLSIVDERTGVALSGRMQCQSIWLVQKNSIFPFANKYDLWGMCSFFFFLFSGHFLLKYEQFFLSNLYSILFWDYISFLKNMAGWWGLYQIYIQMDKIHTISQSYANKPR